MVDLGAPAQISRVEVDWETGFSSRYVIEVSNDRENWTTASAVVTKSMNGTMLPPLADRVDVTAAGSWRYIRLNSTERGWRAGDGSQYGISLYEFRVFGTGGSAGTPAPIPEPMPGTGDFQLVWADEFDSGATTARLDASKWRYEIGDGCDRGLCGWGNGERQFYTDSIENVFMQNGILNIALRKDHQNRAYTSGRVTTLGRYEFTYGRVAARIRFQTPASSGPGAKDGPVGVWGAFWTLGKDVVDPYVGWPYSGELDVMEMIGYSWWYSSALHGPGHSGGGSIGGSYNKEDTSTGIVLGNLAEYRAGDWNDYEMEWDANRVEFRLNGRTFRTVTRAEVEARGLWVYNKPNFLILNVAYDGAYPAAYRNNPRNFTGARTANGLSTAAENAFPHTMQVDWVRVYQRR